MATREERRAVYAEKLKDPRWQKKRLQIFERDGWACQRCFGSDETLHLHHLWYEPGQEPWDAEDAALMTLCAECHGNETHDRPMIEETVVRSLRIAGFLSGEILEIGRGFAVMKMTHVREVVAQAIAWVISDPVLQRQLVDRFLEQQSRKRRATELYGALSENRSEDLE